MKVQIRKATIEDASGIAKVHVRSWQETYQGIVSQDYLDSLKVDDRKPLWKKSLSESADTSPVFVAVNSEGEIVGFASFGKERSGNFDADGELYAIYILKEYQGMKLGMKLLLAGLEDLLKQDYEAMLVWVLADNESRKFYESLQPQKAGEEVVNIAGKKYLEVAYIWKNIKMLHQTTIEKL
ncbi:GNAT family N-acetyltransferase [Mesobacillus subterraneus]|uniref:GNAT family N-acetyltransferase n=1 Tax=Mesobacillus subterraneus TaxID=285983 RepID=UPI001CFDA321|nr:GNAT family N-acetyltransferase [Mesobacillus subterraneus]WLR55952.1 GNAT family N-acetyltransferase [Mesobacillus subterraneus]